MREHDESGASVDDASGGVQDGRVTVADGLVNTPVLAGRRGRSDRDEVDIASYPGYMRFSNDIQQK